MKVGTAVDKPRPRPKVVAVGTAAEKTGTAAIRLRKVVVQLGPAGQKIMGVIKR